MQILQKINVSFKIQLGLSLFLSTLLFLPSFAHAKKSDNLSSKLSTMSDRAKIKDVAKKINSFQSIHSQITKKLADATNRQDLLATDCLRDKLTRVKALMLLAERSRASFIESIAKKDKLKANQEFFKISQAHSRVKDLEVEAGQCRGRTGVYDGKTKVDFEKPPRITKENPTITPWKEPIVYRPAEASRFY